MRWNINNKIMALCMVLAISTVLNGCSIFSTAKEEIPITPVQHREENPADTAGTDQAEEQGNELPDLNAEGLVSPHMILMDLQDGTILSETDSDERCYPASMTKMMTAIVALESISDLNQEIMLGSSVFQRVAGENASVAGFLEGEFVTAIDLLYGVLLPSGAECSIGLAEHIAGSEEAFAERMNQKAAELGMENSHFVNATGLHDDDHYSTVKDMGVLLTYCLQNDQFREIFTSFSHVVSSTNLHPDGMTFYSTMTKDRNDFSAGSGRIIGGKTGYTSEAGLCLASLATDDSREYILITAGVPGSSNAETYHLDDAIYIYSQVYE